MSIASRSLATILTGITQEPYEKPKAMPHRKLVEEVRRATVPPEVLRSGSFEGLFAGYIRGWRLEEFTFSHAGNELYLFQKRWRQVPVWDGQFLHRGRTKKSRGRRMHA